MFTPQIYESWQDIQWEKYEEFLKILGKDFFYSILKKKILDIGSGPGYFERFLISKNLDINNIISLDVRKDFMKKVENEALVVGDGNALPFKEGKFDVVVSIDTMHLVKGVDFSRVMKPGGIVFFSVFFSHGVYEERKSLIKSLLKGFEIMFEFEVHTKEKEYAVLAKKN